MPKGGPEQGDARHNCGGGGHCGQAAHRGAVRPPEPSHRNKLRSTIGAIGQMQLDSFPIRRGKRPGEVAHDLLHPKVSDRQLWLTHQAAPP